MKRSSSTWMHKFADAGRDALKEEFTRQGLTTPEDKAEYVAFLLGDADDMSTADRPFIWKSTYDDAVTEPTVSISDASCIPFLTDYVLGHVPGPSCCTSVP